MAKKATPQDAQLILKLYDLRREPEMRKARHWFTAEFWPQNVQELVKLANSFPSRKRLAAAGGRILGHGGIVRPAGRAQ